MVVRLVRREWRTVHTGLPRGRADTLREGVPHAAHLDFRRLGHDESVQVSVYRPDQDSLERESSDCARTRGPSSYG